MLRRTYNNRTKFLVENIEKNTLVEYQGTLGYIEDILPENIIRYRFGTEILDAYYNIRGKVKFVDHKYSADAFTRSSRIYNMLRPATDQDISMSLRQPSPKNRVLMIHDNKVILPLTSVITYRIGKYYIPNMSTSTGGSAGSYSGTSCYCTSYEHILDEIHTVLDLETKLLYELKNEEYKYLEKVNVSKTISNQGDQPWIKRKVFEQK